ncbi:WhiB family transcriptional regulator [Streptomyces sp. NPDC015130]|uniref:WhiB family transcriptional regulator n=1 Tax=Streptomyces sp. NPDC015130 TaxID=3364940 RepID=UPI0036FE9815
MTTSRALTALTEHRHYAYRGCAPDPDQPTQSAADPDLPLDAWGISTIDGGQEPGERLDHQRRAIDICHRCPVLAACAAYANTEIPGGGLVEPDGIWGGQKSLERHRALIDRRSAVPVPAEPAAPPAGRLEAAGAPTKLAVLRALARETDAELVAYRAGMDLRTANWHRAALCTLLGLDKETASRDDLLAAAIQHKILPARTRIVPDGRWPIAAAPTTDGTRQRRLAPSRPIQLAIPGLPDYPRTTPTPAPAPAAAPRRHLALVTRAVRTVPLLLPVRTLEARAA